MSFVNFLKEHGGEILFDVSLVFIVISAFHLNIWQACAFALFFARVQSRILTELLGIHVYIKHMFEPVIKTELVVNSIREDVRAIQLYLFKKDLDELDKDK